MTEAVQEETRPNGPIILLVLGIISMCIGITLCVLIALPSLLGVQ
jgi:hypothetical protein